MSVILAQRPIINLSKEEIQIIRYTFATVRTTSKTFGADLFIRFFSKHPDFQGMFKSFKDIPIEFGDVPLQTLRVNKKLLAHGTYVLYTVGMLVDHLEFADTLEQMLKRLARNHHRRKVKILAFELLKEIWIEQMQVTLGPMFNEAAANSWRKFFLFITNVIDIFYEEFEILEVDTVDGFGGEFGGYRHMERIRPIYRANSYSRMNSINPYFEPRLRQHQPTIIANTGTTVTTSPDRPKSTCSTEMLNTKVKTPSTTKKLLNLVFKPFKFFKRNKQ